MKFNSFFKTSCLAVLMLFAFQTNAQDFKPLDKSPMDVAAYPDDYRDANKLVKVQYSRPYLNDRALSKLAPNGEVWRTGANEAPEITLYTDMKLGSTTVKAGTYSLLTIPGENEWTVIIHSGLNEWGGYFYKEENDVARISVPVSMADDSLENFSIKFTKSSDGVDMHMGWDKVRVSVPFTK